MERIFSNVSEAERFRLQKVSEGFKTRIVVTENYTKIIWEDLKKVVDTQKAA